MKGFGRLLVETRKEGFRACVLFCVILFFVCVVNLLLTGGNFRFVLGRPSHTLLTIFLATGFISLFCKDLRDLVATSIAYALLLIPVVMLSTMGPPTQTSSKHFFVSISEANCWALSMAMLTILVTASSVLFSSTLVRYFIRAVAAILWLFIILLVLFFVGYWMKYHSVLTPEILVAIWQTNPQEAVEYLSGEGLIELLIGVVLGIIALLVRIVRYRQSLVTHHLRVDLFFVVAIILAVFCVLKTQSNLTLGLFNDAYETVRELDRFKQEVENRQRLLTKLPDMNQKGDTGLFVVVIGESHTRDRMSAYEYSRDTTPWLRSRREKNNGFVFLENAYSNYPNTLNSLTLALTLKSQYDNFEVRESPSIIEILKTAGFETWWISTQNRIGVWDTPVSVIASLSDEQRWLIKETDKWLYGSVFDEALVEELAKIPVSNQKRVVFLHMTGAHMNYKQRYPMEFELWPILDKKNQDAERENAYDNAMFYDDHVWQLIYDHLRNRSDFRALFVTSDHGEDATLGIHTPDLKLFTWSMVRIPTWVYFSESYEKDHPDRVEALRSNASKPWTNDMLYDALLGLTGVTGHSFYSEENDIFSSKYDRPWQTLRTIHGILPLTEDPSGLRGQSRKIDR